MDVLAAPYLAAAALLVAAGASKVADPLSLVRALRSAGLPAGRTLVRLLALAEVLLGLLAGVHGSRLAAVGVAISYAVFTAFVLVALRRGGVLASCGCFGKADTPPTLVHAVVTGGFALVAAVVAVRPLGPLADVLGDAPWFGIPLLLTAAAVAAAAYVVMVVLPLLSADVTAAPAPFQATQGTPTLLVFVTAGSSVPRPPDGTRSVLVTDRPDDENHRLWATFQVPHAPYVVLVDGRGRAVGEGSPAAGGDVSDVMRDLVVDAGARAAPRR